MACRCQSTFLNTYILKQAEAFGDTENHNALKELNMFSSSYINVITKSTDGFEDLVDMVVENADEAHDHAEQSEDLRQDVANQHHAHQRIAVECVNPTSEVVLATHHLILMIDRANGIAAKPSPVGPRSPSGGL